MRNLAFILLILIGCSWLSNLAEGIICDEETHENISVLTAPDTDHTDGSHVCHAGSCHFGHCAHIVPRASAQIQENTSQTAACDPSPYALQALSGACSLPLRPPVLA